MQFHQKNRSIANISMLKNLETKIQQLSQDELVLLHNREVLFLKASVLMKIRNQFELLIKEIEPILAEQSNKIFSTIQFAAPKISKGENYLNLPYLVLDYPAQFAQPSIFTFRTLFWWGNYFSFTLHLQGTFLEKFRTQLIQNTAKIKQSEFYLCIHESPWNYTYDADNYKPAHLFSDTELRAYFGERNFIKISTKMNLEEYPDLTNKALSTFKNMVEFLS